MPRAPVLPLPTLETERLVLRPHRLDDAEELFVMRTHPEGVRFLSGLAPTSVEDLRVRLGRVLADIDGLKMLGWTLTLRGDNRLIGILGVSRVDWDATCAELGYELTHAQWGKGLMLEAVSRVIEHMFDALDFHRLEIRTEPENLRSVRIAERLGFVLEGHLREHERHPDGRYLDSLVFGKLNPAHRGEGVSS